MVMEDHTGTSWATSIDGQCWVKHGHLFGLSGQDYDSLGQVTPFLEVSGDKLRAVWFGGAHQGYTDEAHQNAKCAWCSNRIGAAYPKGEAPSGGGCAGCTPAGSTCTSACQAANAGSAGSCANPGSTSPGACCNCSNDECAKCVGSAANCQQACINIGSSIGFCAHPGSTDPSKCCACLD